MFNAVREGRMDIPGVDADTAPATQRLVVIFVWVLAIALPIRSSGQRRSGVPGDSACSSPHGVPGASNVVGQATSGYILMYSRSLRVGDYVRVEDVRGDRGFDGMLSYKIRTPGATEEINIPHAVIVQTDHQELDSRLHPGHRRGAGRRSRDDRLTARRGAQVHAC